MASVPKQNFFRQEIHTIHTQQQGASETHAAHNAAQPAATAVKNRMCPTADMGFRLSDFSPFGHGDKRLMFRRICMLGILLIRTAISILLCVNMIRFSLVWFVVDVIVAIIGFICTVWILRCLGDVRGKRRALGVMVGQAQVDLFLFAMLVIHSGMVALSVFGSLRIVGHSAWFLLIISMWLVAWVTTWPAESEGGEYV